jgi:YegS/Rv2252/BmrU family lipid kinase
MSKSDLTIIINPNAGNGSTGKKWPWIKELAGDRLGRFQYHMTEGPGDADRLTREAIGSDARRIVCIGGDGTLNEVVNGIMTMKDSAADVVLGFVPDGTGCDFVRTIAIPKNIEKAIDIIARHRTRNIDAGRLHFRGHNGQECYRYFHNIASFGLGGAVDERVNRTTKAFGPFLSFIWATVISILFVGKKRVWLSIDNGVEEEFNVWNVAVANGQYFGGGMQVAPDARVDDAQFDITIVGDMSLPEVFYHLPKLYNGKIKTIEKVVSATGKHLLARSVEPVLLDVDGEQPGILPAAFDIVPEALTIISDSEAID